MERYHIHSFGWRKGRRMSWEKNKAVTPRLAFPFCLKTAENQSNSEKEELCFYYYGMTTQLSEYFPGCFLITP